jgi:hypothetical protein
LLIEDGASFSDEPHFGAALSEVGHREQVAEKLRHVENVLQDRRRRGAFSVHGNGDAPDTSGLNGTVVAKYDVNGAGERGVMMEPVSVSAHVA